MDDRNLFAVLKWVGVLSGFRHPIILSRATLHDKWLIGWPLTKVSTHQPGNKQQWLLIFLCSSPQNKMNQNAWGLLGLASGAANGVGYQREWHIISVCCKLGLCCFCEVLEVSVLAERLSTGRGTHHMAATICRRSLWPGRLMNTVESHSKFFWHDFVRWA